MFCFAVAFYLLDEMIGKGEDNVFKKSAFQSGFFPGLEACVLLAAYAQALPGTEFWNERHTQKDTV